MIGCGMCAVGDVQRWGCLGCGSEGAVGRVVYVPLYGHCLAPVAVSLL